MIHKESVHSSIGDASRFVFVTNDGFDIEFLLVNQPAKTIICVPTQTMCRQACAFCSAATFSEDYPSRNLRVDELLEGIRYALDVNGPKKGRHALVSFMGCGEPLLNLEVVIATMQSVYNCLPNTKFALATSIPRDSGPAMDLLAECVKLYDLPLKLSFSMHFATDSIRKKWMPNATPLEEAFHLLDKYHDITNRPVLVHYTPINNVNDGLISLTHLAQYLRRFKFPVRFIKFSATGDLAPSPDRHVDLMCTLLNARGVVTEYFKPDGNDIDSGCGRFLLHLKKELP